MTHQECWPPCPLFLTLAELAGTLPQADLLSPWWVSILLSKWGLLAKEAPLDSGTGLFCTLKWDPVNGLVLPPLLEGKDWDKPMEGCYCACATDHFIWPYRQGSLGGTTSLRPSRKGNCEAQTSWHCLEAELKTWTKVQAELLSHLDTALVSNSHTSEAGVTPSSESGREEMYQQGQLWGKKWVAPHWQWHEQQHQC